MLYWLTEDKNIQAKYYFIKRNKLILKKQNLKFEPFLKLLLWTLINSVDSFDSKLLDFFFTFIYVYVYMSLCVCHISACFHRGQKKPSNPLELEVKAIMSWEPI